MQKTNGIRFPFYKRKQKDSIEIVSIPIGDRPIDDLLNKEWLLTNFRGGYASSTIIGCNTRRYHALLTGSLNPPVDRIIALANCLEMVIFDSKVFNLSTFEFNDKFTPSGFGYIKQFRQDIGVHFDYQLDKLKLTKSIYLSQHTDTVALVYDFTSVTEPAEFALRPFISLRNFHTLQKSYAPLCATNVNNGLLIRHDTPESCELFLSCPSMNFEMDKQWWFNILYRTDRERGQDFTEDLWTPGFFKCRIDSPTKIILWAKLSRRHNAEQSINTDLKTISQELLKRQADIISAAKHKDEKFRILCIAADQFIAKRQITNLPNTNTTKTKERTTILAGFPWFADWGRDTFIALPGLLLARGKFDEAKSVLTSFAEAADDGLIPNRFDDNSNTAYFNSIDASLWFIIAAFQYLNATGDSQSFTQSLLPVIRWIIDSYQQGSCYGISCCPDGLITGGNHETQLTWMDAKYDGVAFTPRYGKAVEINALWINCLRLLAQFYAGQGLPKGNSSHLGVPRNTENAKNYESMASKASASFCKLFWNETKGYLNDCILPDGSVDESLRPNQIFAVSLPFSPLPPDKQRSVVDVVQKNLLTPYGLRTLVAGDPRYKGTYTGPQQQRDEAYHQGTVWPYLIGPFVEAYLKVNNFSRKSKTEASAFIKPLMQHLTEDGCLGQIGEIFDGDPLHKPKGCFAQAWSVAELIRAYLLINS